MRSALLSSGRNISEGVAMLSKYRTFSFAILCVAILSMGCNLASHSAPANAQLGQPSQISDSQNRTLDLNQFFNLESFPVWTKGALQSFFLDGRFRISGPKSFRIPEAAKKETYARIDIETATTKPFITGDINHDGLYQDIVLIVEDSANAGNERFGIIIFNEPAGRKTAPTPIWLLRDRDLSRTTLNWWSGGLSIRTYNDDGTYKLCYVNWGAKTKAYSCDEKWRK